METQVLPMFPLGSVLVPHMVLPLHVFEPRYREMMRALTAGDGRFGVVLIARGHEVGGGETRTDVGTVARVVQAEELDDGRWVAIAVGTRRLRVVEWLVDDPYPRAQVQLLDDAGDDGDLAAQLRDDVAVRIRRILAMRSELDEPAAPADTELDDDPGIASFQAAVLAPLGPMDAQGLLELPGATARLQRLVEELDHLEAELTFRLGPR